MSLITITFGFLEHSGNGFMARGGAHLNEWVNLTYAGYYSFETTADWVGAENMLGGRTSTFFPWTGTEVGLSYNWMQEAAEDTTIQGFGVDVTQQFRDLSVDFKGELASLTERGTGYWIEVAHRFVHSPIWKPFFKRFQLVLRWEQFYAPAMDETEAAEEGHTALPEEDTNRLKAGGNYFLTNDLKVSASYGITQTTSPDEGLFDAGISWRF